MSLRTLDLSHNQLERLDNKTHGLLDDCLSLERVSLVLFLFLPPFSASLALRVTAVIGRLLIVLTY